MSKEVKYCIRNELFFSCKCGKPEKLIKSKKGVKCYNNNNKNKNGSGRGSGNGSGNGIANGMGMERKRMGIGM